VAAALKFPRGGLRLPKNVTESLVES
jgi:hypothetical protein